MSQLSDFTLPVRNILIVLPDEGVKPTTGTIVKNSPSMGGLFRDETPYAIDNHIIFHRSSIVEIKLDDIDYYLMHKNAVMGALE